MGRRREKALVGKQLLRQSNTGEGDTLTSRMCCHGYQSPVCHPFLAPSPVPCHSRGKGKAQKGAEYDIKGEKDTKRMRKETTDGWNDYGSNKSKVRFSRVLFLLYFWLIFAFLT